MTWPPNLLLSSSLSFLLSSSLHLFTDLALFHISNLYLLKIWSLIRRKPLFLIPVIKEVGDTSSSRLDMRSGSLLDLIMSASHISLFESFCEVVVMFAKVILLGKNPSDGFTTFWYHGHGGIPCAAHSHDVLQCLDLKYIRVYTPGAIPLANATSFASSEKRPDSAFGAPKSGPPMFITAFMCLAHQSEPPPPPIGAGASTHIMKCKK